MRLLFGLLKWLFPASPALTGLERVIVVSHGFQTNYENGFCNGLAERYGDFILISSDETDYARLHSNVHWINMRGSQRSDRGLFCKVFNYLRYHFFLLVMALGCRSKCVHVIGLVEPKLLCGFIEGVWLRLFSRRYFLTVHDLLPHDRHGHVAWALSWLSFRMPHRLVLHTEKMRDDVQLMFGVSPSKLMVMQHGLDVLSDRAQTYLRKVRSDLSRSQLVKLLFFGNVAPYKGLDVLLQSLKCVDFDFSLTVVGRCRSAVYAKKILLDIDQLGLNGKVVWVNEYVSEADVFNFFVHSHVLVLPYRYIDQSGVFFQALKHGLPVVASRVGAFDQYVSAEVGLLARPGDPEDLARILTAFVISRDTYSMENILTMSNRYRWTEVVGVLVDSYVGLFGLDDEC